MKNLYILTALLLCSPALAQSTNFFGPSGAYEGSAYTTGGAANYYGPSGQYLGNSYSNSGSTNYYAPNQIDKQHCERGSDVNQSLATSGL